MTKLEEWVNQTIAEFTDHIHHTDIPAWIKTRQIHAVRQVLESAVTTVEIYEPHADTLDTH